MQTNENDDIEPIVMARGVVGWANAESHFDLGSGDNDGVTLVRVTLFKGRHKGAQPPQSMADGHEILVQVGGPVWAVPPKGQAVLIAFPDGDPTAVGAGVIVAWLGKSPSLQFTGERAVIDVGSDLHLVVKGKSVTFTDYGDAGDGVHSRWITVGAPPAGGEPGITFQDETGSGGIISRGVVAWFSASGGDAKTVLQLTPTELSGIQKSAATSYFRLKNGNITTFGTANQVVGGGVYLGKSPLVVNTALWGPTGVAGVASPSVFISAV